MDAVETNLKYVFNISHLLTYRAPPCSNEPAFVVMCHALRFCALSAIILYHFISSQMLSIANSSCASSLLFPCAFMFNIFLVVASPSFPNTWTYHISRMFLRKVIGSMLASLHADDFILSSSPSQHSHLTGVYVLCIVMWNVNMYSGLSQTNPFYLLPFRCYRIIKIPENTFRNFSTLEPIARMCIT